MRLPGEVCTPRTLRADSNTKLNARVKCEGENFIIKNVIPGDFEYQQELQKPLASCPNLRTVVDTIPDFQLFVYHFLAGDLLQISQRSLSEETRRSILRSALIGLAELHDRGIVHTGESFSHRRTIGITRKLTI